MGMAVLIGGPPTISMSAMAMKAGMGALGKGPEEAEEAAEGQPPHEGAGRQAARQGRRSVQEARPRRQGARPRAQRRVHGDRPPGRCRHRQGVYRPRRLRVARSDPVQARAHLVQHLHLSRSARPRLAPQLRHGAARHERRADAAHRRRPARGPAHGLTRRVPVRAARAPDSALRRTPSVQRAERGWPELRVRQHARA
jgi:hypothetical protein